MPLWRPQGFSRAADSKYVKCLGIYVSKQKIIIKHFPHLYLYLQNDLLFFYSKCPGMDQDLMKLCFIRHTGLLGVLISEWVAK